MIKNIEVPFPPGVSDYINVAAIAQLNLEIMQHSCVFGEAEEAYYTKVRIFFWLPVFLVGTLCLVYGAYVSFWRLRPLTAELQASGYVSASATDRLERFRDQLCSVGCCVFTMLYVSTARLASSAAVGGVESGLLTGTHR
jgi:hypothetical protein